MKKEKAFVSGISILIGAVIAVLALAPKSWQTPLLLTTFILWGTWTAAIYLLPRIQRERRRRQRRRRLHAGGTSRPTSFNIPKIGNTPAEQLLLRHVNHRISAFFRSAYTEDVTWE